MASYSELGPYLYVTLDEAADSYQGIIIEDIRADYREVVRFHGETFAADVAEYLAWVDTLLQTNEDVEIYESDALCDRIKASQP